MATVLEELNRLKALVHSGHQDEVIHVVMTEREAKRRRENPKKTTRLSMEMHSPEAYSEFHVERERFFAAAKDPRIAIDLIIRALRQVDDATLHKWLESGHEPEPESLPDWLRE